ncbi:hypothetical protein EUTSA_v10002334mg [Eutrema salsugineum]|uniref:Uncharacterized protein n=1 Tax=Eutrema salsugineum TaxID=72664 RepID=V4M202_EUTSA|nr:hypothetical protein EUTSA_v10002334mg [Eutrema salsugineum]
MLLLLQICHASKDYSFALKQLPCCYITSYWVLLRRSEQKFNALILKRLFMSKVNKALSLYTCHFHEGQGLIPNTLTLFLYILVYPYPWSFSNPISMNSVFVWQS